MGFFSSLKKLNSADGTREAMRRSYAKHSRELSKHRLPSGTSLHDAALYGALASRYKVSGSDPNELEPFIWAELVPIRWLPESIAPDVLAEYVVWKEEETRDEARKEWLAEQLRAGVRAASEIHPDMVQQAYAMGPEGQYSSPWTDLVPRPPTP